MKKYNNTFKCEKEKKIRKYGYWNKLSNIVSESPRFETSRVFSWLVRECGYKPKAVEIKRSEDEK